MLVRSVHPSPPRTTPPRSGYRAESVDHDGAVNGRDDSLTPFDAIGRRARFLEVIGELPLRRSWGFCFSKAVAAEDREDAAVGAPDFCCSRDFLVVLQVFDALPGTAAAIVYSWCLLRAASIPWAGLCGPVNRTLHGLDRVRQVARQLVALRPEPE